MFYKLIDQSCQPQTLCQKKLLIAVDGQRKTFNNRTKFNQILFTKAATQKVVDV